jgi:hypothetical protein
MDIGFWLNIAIFVVIFIILSKVFTHFNPAADGAAKKIHKQLEELYAGLHQFQEVTPREFPHIDTAHYDQCERWLAGQGFRKLGDIEDLTLSKVYPELRTFLRVFVSHDGSIAAACYDINPRGWMKLAQWVRLMPRNFRTLDLETEFINGAFLRTSNALGKQLMDAPPSISQNLLPDTTTFEDLLNAHSSAIHEWRQADEGFAPKLHRTLDDVIGMQHREQDITNAWRKEIGYVTPEEMKRMAGKSGQKNAEQVMREIARINEKKRPGPPPLTK